MGCGEWPVNTEFPWPRWWCHEHWPLTFRDRKHVCVRGKLSLKWTSKQIGVRASQQIYVEILCLLLVQIVLLHTGLWQSGQCLGHENRRMCTDVWGPWFRHQQRQVLSKRGCFCHRIWWCHSMFIQMFIFLSKCYSLYNDIYPGSYYEEI